MLSYFVAISKDDYADAALLFKEYAGWLNIDLSFQHFEEELEILQQMYALPYGGIILCRHNGAAIACTGLRKIDDITGELKRMYVQPAYQRKGIAGELLKHCITLAQECGYESIKLDTLRTMIPAMNFYKANGFSEIDAYYHNPVKDVVYFERRLV